MWVLEMTDKDGKVIKRHYSNHETAFKLFDRAVRLGISVKHPYYI